MSAEDDGFIEAGAHTTVDASLLESIDLGQLRLDDNRAYQVIVKQLRELHSELLSYESKGKLGNYVENPSLIGDYLGKLRLNCNRLFQFSNIYIDILSDLQTDYAKRRQAMYVEYLERPKASPSAAEKHCREMTRVDESKISFVENCMQQVKNEYERYNGICMYLQSRMKEFNTEKVMG